MSDPEIEVTVSKCWYGHDSYCLIINELRVLGAKCCGRWRIVRRWMVQPSELQEYVDRALDGNGSRRVGWIGTDIGDER